MGAEVLLVIVVGLVTGGGGVLLYRFGKGTVDSSTTAVTPALNPNADCNEACTQFDAARIEQCKARSDEARTKAQAEAASSDYWAAFGAWSGVSLAAAAAMALPWPFNLIVGVALSAVATVLLGVASALLGKLIGANQAHDDAAAKLRAIDDIVFSARTAVTQKCPPDRASACLGLPGPC